MKLKITSLFAVLIMVVILTSVTLKQSTTQKKMDYVPYESTAIKIAEAVWQPIYGEGINDKKPFIAILDDQNTWHVRGTLEKGKKGGVPHIWLRKSDGKIIKVIHGK